jgi:hypothetical protein
MRSIIHGTLMRADGNRIRRRHAPMAFLLRAKPDAMAKALADLPERSGNST